MAEVNEDELQQVRAKAQELKAKVKTDPQLAQQLVDNPAAALKAQGFPDAAIGDILQKNGIQAEVAGYDIDVCHGATYCITAGDTVWCTDTSYCSNTVYHY